MFTSKIRTAAAVFVVAASIGTASTVATPSADAATKAVPTGDATMDAFCSGVAKLVNKAMEEYNAALARNNPDEAALWHAQAEYMLRRATNHGCHFEQARKVLARGNNAPRPGSVRATTTGGKATGGKAPRPGSLLTAKRIKANPTGDVDLDRYCSEIADLVNKALADEASEKAAGHPEKAAEWRAYANNLIHGARSRGCSFSKAREIRQSVTSPGLVTSPQTAGEAGPAQIDTGAQSAGRAGLRVRP